MQHSKKTELDHIDATYLINNQLQFNTLIPPVKNINTNYIYIISLRIIIGSAYHPCFLNNLFSVYDCDEMLNYFEHKKKIQPRPGSNVSSTQAIVAALLSRTGDTAEPHCGHGETAWSKIWDST